ncbi:hypothetical protein CT3_22410 [Comamonas terrigena NBRC 13299]|nr:hypothetical protein CT3_22410 [Comamonas terrigena NBRC 13299]
MSAAFGTRGAAESAGRRSARVAYLLEETALNVWLQWVGRVPLAPTCTALPTATVPFPDAWFMRSKAAISVLWY